MSKTVVFDRGSFCRELPNPTPLLLSRISSRCGSHWPDRIMGLAEWPSQSPRVPAVKLHTSANLIESQNLGKVCFLFFTKADLDPSSLLLKRIESPQAPISLTSPEPSSPTLITCSPSSTLTIELPSTVPAPNGLFAIASGAELQLDCPNTFSSGLQKPRLTCRATLGAAPVQPRPPKIWRPKKQPRAPSMRVNCADKASALSRFKMPTAGVGLSSWMN